MSSLEVLKTKEEQFHNNYKTILKKIKNKKISEYDPKIEELNGVYDIIKKYIKEKRRKIYGGYALNILLCAKNKSNALYDESDIPDIDFYSFEPLVDLVALCDLIHKKGFKPVIGQEAQHKETYSIFVNYQLYCDISYMPLNIFNKVKFVEIDGWKIVHPSFIMIDYFRMFTDPMVSYWRLEKHFDRYMKLQKVYPLPMIKRPLILEKYVNKQLDKTMNLIFDFLANKSTILFTGFYAYNYYLNYSKYNLFDKKYVNVNTPYYEVYSTDYVKDGLDILEYISTFAPEIAEKISHVENYPFYQYYGYNTVIYYTEGKDTLPILYLYSNNKRCIPYKKVNYMKFEGNTIIKDDKKKLNIGTFDHHVLHSLIILVKIKVDGDDDWADVLYTYINGIVLFRNYWLETNNENIYSDSLFQSFVVECMGETILPDREKRLIYETRKKIGKAFIYKYEAGVSAHPGQYNFLNSSGNQINRDVNLRLVKENIGIKLADEIINSELTHEKFKQAKHLDKGKQKKTKIARQNMRQRSKSESDVNDLPNNEIYGGMKTFNIIKK